MLRGLLHSASHWKNTLLLSNQHQRWIHSRNKKAMELVAKGWNALQEVDRVIDHTERNDPRLIPQLRTAKDNFELALEVDNSNTHARYWLGMLHFKYDTHVPGSCPAVGSALLLEAAEMGNADAQYEVGRHLRTKDDIAYTEKEAFYYIKKAVDQSHPDALYLLGAVYLTGDCVEKDIASAMWCFHRASMKGHAGAAIAYGSLLLKGFEVPEAINKFKTKKGRGGVVRALGSNKTPRTWDESVHLAKKQFEIAITAGCDLGLQWLKRLIDYDEKVQKDLSLSM
ncbi:Binding protein [Zostera marina]|uniref:Binding protein n=1 Tax=Zostera marina TaxID=29655 RepID=A0A0K9P6V2_ZOSMR|nr:Binding protein [Zostera marina]